MPRWLMTKPHLNQRFGVVCCSRFRGFTLIELVVCIGVMMVLIGLLLPTLAASRESARATRMLALVRSNHAAVVMYANSHQDVFPASDSLVGNCMLRWYVPLVATGLIENERAVDPEGAELTNNPRFSMSGCAFCSPSMMVPGSTVPVDVAESSAIRMSQAAFPAEKGILVQWLHVRGTEHVFWSWNPSESPSSPIAMADGHAISAKCVDFALEHDFFENWVGHPVLSTWNGILGMDKRR